MNDMKIKPLVEILLCSTHSPERTLCNQQVFLGQTNQWNYETKECFEGDYASAGGDTGSGVVRVRQELV